MIQWEPASSKKENCCIVLNDLRDEPEKSTMESYDKNHVSQVTVVQSTVLMSVFCIAAFRLFGFHLFFAAVLLVATEKIGMLRDPWLLLWSFHASVTINLSMIDL